MERLYRQKEVNIKDMTESEVFVNPRHIVAFAIHDDNLVKVDFVNNVSVYLLGDFFTTMARDALDIVPIQYEGENENVELHETEYIDETPLEEPGTVENIPYETTDLSTKAETDTDLEPEQHAGEDDEYEPAENAAVEGEKY
ncbi:hypothetical protein PQC39_gp137 [Vibrio phage Vp_R1]|uniref:Uncharacterized protein n=1 Tax=Vibrio phage Vp_R1 TaxID=2059867 RepID=A0A2H5BQ90_9CAUD|nr:hypothetical protein PQC39_gp137 [Vibrio phage Vp_R1]AUG88501.1 hypothetical protein VPR_137 [Vibrio phage Vp_R1]